MPNDAECGLSRPTGGVNSLHDLPQPNSGSTILPCRQYGAPKCSPTLVTRLSSSSGTSSDIQSRPLSVKYICLVSGFQSNPTELRTPNATTSAPDPSRFIRLIWPWASSCSTLLPGCPTGTYSLLSGPMAMNFQPWASSLGRLS